jgi:hypothetical protein
MEGAMRALRQLLLRTLGVYTLIARLLSYTSHTPHSQHIILPIHRYYQTATLAMLSSSALNHLLKEQQLKEGFTKARLEQYTIPLGIYNKQHPEPTALDILRYRYHHGTNLGSIFVLQRMFCPSIFEKVAEGTNELDAVKSWMYAEGLTKTRQRFELFWKNAISDRDIEDMKKAQCESRLLRGLSGIAFRFN